MSREVVEIVMVAHGIGFLMGAGLMFLLVKYLKRALLDLPKIEFSMQDVQEWIERDQEIQKLNMTTRECLDKLRGNVG